MDKLFSPSSPSAIVKDLEIRKPRIYIAGKISQSDFRHTLVRGLRNHDWDDGFLETEDYTYTGPFFRSCDHGCCHGPNTHGAAEGCTEEYSPKDEILARNNHAIDSSDLVLVYVTQSDCYGTLVEIGRAAAKQKRIVIAFSPDFKQTDDFWCAVGSADLVYHDVYPCCLPLILAREVDRVDQRVTEVVA